MLFATGGSIRLCDDHHNIMAINQRFQRGQTERAGTKKNNSHPSPGIGRMGLCTPADLIGVFAVD